MSRPSGLRLGAVAVLAASLLSGCSSAEGGRAADVADAFHAAVTGGDGARACALLTATALAEVEKSAGKPCAEGLLEEPVPDVGEVLGVTVYDTMVQVRHVGDTTFLTRVDARWRVVAAGCTRRPGDHPYDCEVAGG